MKKQKSKKITKQPTENTLGISERAREIYRVVSENLPDVNGILDAEVLAQYAQSCAEIETLNEQITSEGLTVGRGISPAASARSMVYKSALAAAIQLGLTPLARKNIRIKIAASAGRKKKEVAPEENYL